MDDLIQTKQGIEQDTLIIMCDAIEIATRLGFTLCISGNITVSQWAGRPITDSLKLGNDSLFEADYILHVLFWLEGVAYGRVNNQIINNHD